MCLRCTVVILDLDTLRADEIDCFGIGATVTPNLCRLIRQSTVFSQAYSQSYWTLPSSLSTYSSLYPNVNQVWRMGQGSLAPSTVTLAAYVQSAGYKTTYAGQDADNLLTQRNGGLRGYGHIDNVDIFWGQLLSKFTSTISAPPPVLFHVYTGWLHMPYLLDSDQSPIENLPKPKGFPLFFTEFDAIQENYLAAHATDVFTPETIAQNPDVFRVGPADRGKRILAYFRMLDAMNDYTKRKNAWLSTYIPYMQFIDLHNPQDVAYLHMMYKSTIHTLDSRLAPYINYLLQPDISRHTIVVITSAHGEAFEEHGTLEHDAIPYNELYHVPLIIKYPHGSGRHIDAVVENIDIYPTIVEMVTGKVPDNVQGVSLVPLLSGSSIRAKSYAISINENNVFVLQNRRYALIVYKDRAVKPELYDLIRDPGEQHDIASKHPDIVNQYMRFFVQTHVVPELSIPTPDVLPIPADIYKKDLIRSGYF